MTRSKEPWGEGTPWKTRSQFMSYVRGAIRKAWMRHPVKLNVIKNSRYKIDNPNPKGKAKQVWGFKCECCGGEFIQKEGQVDHKVPAGSFNEPEEIQGFVERLLFVREEDLRLICKNCNSILAYSDKYNMTFNEAKIAKEAIAFEKASQAHREEFFNSRGVAPPKTKKAQRELYTRLRKEEEDV